MDYQPDNSMVAVLRSAQTPGIRDSKARTLVERNGGGPCSTSGNLFSHFSESGGVPLRKPIALPGRRQGRGWGNKCVAFNTNFYVSSSR